MRPIEGDGGETDPIDGDTVPQYHLAHGQLAGAQGQAGVPAPGFDGMHRADRLDDACKHGL